MIDSVLGTDTKFCCKCDKNLDSSCFHKNKTRYDGLQGVCKTCSKYTKTEYRKDPIVKAMDVQYVLKSRSKPGGKERLRAYNLKRLYGLSVQEYTDMLDRQGGKCAICLSVMDRPHVDHDHHTGKVRGILCPLCNIGIGNLGDDPERLERAAEYLRSGSRNRFGETEYYESVGTKGVGTDGGGYGEPTGQGQPAQDVGSELLHQQEADAWEGVRTVQIPYNEGGVSQMFQSYD